jgi:hypothetical protein
MNLNKITSVLTTLGRYGAIFLVNCWRRLLVLWRYTLLCWQQQKMRRSLRRLGTQVFTSCEEGEVNPMLTEAVKDAVKKAQGIKAVKDRHYQAIADLRRKIRAARVKEPPPAPPEEGSGEP